MSSRTPAFFALFPFLVAPGARAQRPAASVDQQLVAAGVWAEARYNYAYWDAVRANWDSALAATVAALARRPGDVEFFHQLRRWGALLNDGQLQILPPPAIASRIARPPLAIRSIEGRPFIIDYAINDEMRVARPERLAEIVAVQGIPAAQWIRDSILPEVSGATDRSRWERAVADMLEGEHGTALHLQLKLPGGADRGASVTRSVPITARWPLEPPSLEVDTLPRGALWVRVNSFADPDVVDRFDRVLRDAARQRPTPRGLIIDLRETTWTAGGREQGYALLARLIDHPVPTSRWRTPQYRPAYGGSDAPDSAGAWYGAPPDTIRPLPGREDQPYSGPVAVLISARTAGPAEDFLVAFENAGRGVLIGERSAGATGQTALLPLAAGWKLRVTVTRDAFPDGREFVRDGIAPTIAVDARVDDVLAGRDDALERARRYLSDRARPSR